MLKRLTYFIPVVLTLNVHAQQAVNTTASQGIGSGGSASYIVGQVSYMTITSSAGSVSQGATQPYEISVITGLAEEEIQLLYSISPNPTSDVMKLVVPALKLGVMTAELLNIQGKVLFRQKLTESETTIPMTDLAPDIYVLKLSDDDKELKTFKIIKN